MFLSALALLSWTLLFFFFSFFLAVCWVCIDIAYFGTRNVRRTSHALARAKSGEIFSVNHLMYLSMYLFIWLESVTSVMLTLIHLLHNFIAELDTCQTLER